MIRKLTCIECPMGCGITVELDGNNIVSVTGNSCPRGKAYATNEVICPRRVLTTTIRTENGKMLPVKTDKPVKKSELISLMKKINLLKAKAPCHIGDIIQKNITEDISLVASGNID